MLQHYQQIIDYMFQFEHIRDYSLEKIRHCAQLLGNPQDCYNIIHIAGTNGKGSTCQMCFSLLKSWSKKVGLFTSPHLNSLTERFQTNKGNISQQDFIRIVNKIIDLNVDLSYFEKCTLIAFEYFKQE